MYIYIYMIYIYIYMYTVYIYYGCVIFRLNQVQTVCLSPSLPGCPHWSLRSTGGYLSAFVEVIPPSHLADEWICKEVSFSIVLMASKKENLYGLDTRIRKRTAGLWAVWNDGLGGISKKKLWGCLVSMLVFGRVCLKLFWLKMKMCFLDWFWWARLDYVYSWEIVLAQFNSHISNNLYFRHFGTHNESHLHTSPTNPWFPNSLVVGGMFF